MEKVPVRDAVGMALCHDITQIIPGTSKSRAFKRGHIITAGDVEALLDLGKEHIYIWHDDEGLVHEDDAASMLVKASIRSSVFLYDDPNQGKVTIRAARRGVLNIDSSVLNEVNATEGMAFATLKSGTVVAEGQTVAGVRVLPLAIDRVLLERAVSICHNRPILADIAPFQPLITGTVTTGNEIFTGRIKDGFRPVLESKLEPYGARLLEPIIVPDQAGKIAEAIRACIDKGAELVCVTGGMSVDPDDVTPSGIRLSGAETAFYGMPVLPGSMIMLAYAAGAAIVGLPGCVMFNKISTFDLMLPHLFTRKRLDRDWAWAKGEGGLCQACPECHYPNCSFFGS